MALAGGAADKLGNGYERRFTVLAMIEILMGRADSIRVEVPGDAGAGAEFRLRVGAASQWTQSKRQRGNGSWTLNALLREKFLQAWLPKLRAGDTCIFSSTTSADDLRQLCASAQDAIDLAEFEGEFLKSGRRKKIQTLQAAWGTIGIEEAYQLLSQIQVDTIDDRRLDQQIETSLYVLVAGNVKAVRRVLLQYADDVIHKEVTADDIWDFLQDNGISRAGRIAPAAYSPTASPEARWISERLERLPLVTHGRITAAMATDERAARRLVRMLTEHGPPPQELLQRCAQQQPKWLIESDWDTLLAAAELAGAYGTPRLQAHLFLELARQGCPSEQLWIARAVFAHTVADDRVARDELLEQLSSGRVEHPYARAVIAVFASQFSDALRQVRAWTPEDPADRAAKAVLLIQISLGHPDEAPSSEALTRAHSVANELLAEQWHGGIALWRARTLTLRARQRGSKILFGDLRLAQETALRVRDDRRICRANSAEAAAVSCEAAGVRGDLDFVLRTGLPAEHGGTATAEEFHHSDVAFHVAMAALQLRRFDIAQLAAEHVTSPFHHKLLEALSAQVRREDGSRLWREAVDLAADNHEYLDQALNGLARTGATDLPRLEELRQVSTEAAEEVQATAEMHAGEFDRSIANLRIQRHKSLTAAMTLAEAYRSTGSIDSAAETLLDAADKFNDPSLRLQAAIVLAGAGHAERARRIISDLIRDRDHDWPEFTEVLKFAAQQALDGPDLELAVSYCRQILQHDLRDTSTRWVLINSLMILDRLTDAWEVFCGSPEDLQPETRVQAQMCVELHRRFADPATAIRACLDALRRFRDDEELSAFALHTVMLLKPTDDPVPAELLGDYHEDLERFFERWPDSPYLRRIRTEDDELLIKSLTDSLRPTPERLAERRRLTREFYRAEKPLVVMAEYAGRSYSEVLIHRGTGVLPMVHPDTRESQVCRETIRLSVDNDVAIDASAIAVLSTLPREVRDAALAVFRRAITTEEVARDARQYREDLSRTSGTLFYNAETDGPGYAELTDEQVTAAKARLTAIQVLIEQLHRRPIQPKSQDRRMRVNVQASVVQLSASKRIAVWCDDVASRMMMRNIGVATFSTLAVLEHLLAKGKLATSEYDAALDIFVRERIGISHPGLPRILRIARQEAWQPANAAACLTQPQAWADVAETSEIAGEVLRLCHRERAEHVPGWLHAAVFGAVMNCPNARAAVEIGALLLAGNLLRLTARGQLAREMVTATRIAVAAAFPVDNPAGIATDPLPAAAVHLRTLLLAHTGVSANEVFPLILGFLDELDEQDTRTVTEAILSKDR